MEPRKPARTGRTLLLSLLLFSLATIPQMARADEPQVAIRLVGGESAIYVANEIERIVFESGETLVVVTAGGSDDYPAASITRIEFLWGVTAVENPEDAARLVKAIHLFQSLPNPFSLGTRIGFELPRGGGVELSIYSPEGRLIRTLVNGTREAGHHEAHWDGLNDSGRRVSSGVYFYSLRAPGIEESRRTILLP